MFLCMLHILMILSLHSIVCGGDDKLWFLIKPQVSYPSNCHKGGYENVISPKGVTYFKGVTYIARRRIRHEVVVGKTVKETSRGYFAIDGVEEEHGDFEVFCNNLNVQWVKKEEINENWIVGGMAGDGNPFYICRGVIENKDNLIIPGKYYEPNECCYVGLYKKELCLHDFSILAYNSSKSS